MKLSPLKLIQVITCLLIGIILALSEPLFAQEGEKWITFKPADGPSNGKYIVLVSGDEEYRSEESLPALAKILTYRHGFNCTVLFAINPKTGEIDPNFRRNIPGLKKLKEADLMVLFTRRRPLPAEQMKYIDEYIQAGKPIMGMRTATHAFDDISEESPYYKYSASTEAFGWEGGFGRQILGETWAGHHGNSFEEGTRGIVDGIMDRKNYAILRGVQDIWGATDVYGINQLKGDAQVLLWGMPTDGMSPDSPIRWDKTAMPVAWIKHYTSEKGNTGRVFTTTMGASVDLKSEDLRRLLVNAAYWAVGMENQIPQKSDVEFVGEFNPTSIGFDAFQTGMRPSDFKPDPSFIR